MREKKERDKGNRTKVVLKQIISRHAGTLLSDGDCFHIFCVSVAKTQKA